MSIRRVDAEEGRGWVSARPRPRQKISRAGRGVYDWPHLVVIPTVRIVVHHDHRRALPCRLLLQEIDERYEQRLLIERIGVSGVTVLECLRLDEAHCRKIARPYGIVKIVQIVAVVSGTVVTDFRN